MATVVSKQVRHLRRLLGFFNNFIFRKTQQILLELVENVVFLASNSKIIEDRVKKKNLEQIFPEI